MSAAQIHTIDSHYTGAPEIAAAYLIVGREGWAFVETNTNRAIPHLLGALERVGASPAEVRYVIIDHADGLRRRRGPGVRRSHRRTRGARGHARVPDPLWRPP